MVPPIFPASTSIETAVSAFNPYKTWLNLDQSKPNYFQLLRLTESVYDAAEISAAATKAINGLRQHKPGSQAKAWMALMDELKAAKKCLSDPAQRKAYLKKIRADRHKQNQNPNMLPPTGPLVSKVEKAKAEPVKVNPKPASLSELPANLAPVVPNAETENRAKSTVASSTRNPATTVAQNADPSSAAIQAQTMTAVADPTLSWDSHPEENRGRTINVGWAGASPSVATQPATTSQVFSNAMAQSGPTGNEAAYAAARDRYASLQRSQQRNRLIVLCVFFLLLAGTAIGGFIYKDRIIAAFNDSNSVDEDVPTSQPEKNSKQNSSDGGKSDAPKSDTNTITTNNNQPVTPKKEEKESPKPADQEPKSEPDPNPEPEPKTETKPDSKPDPKPEPKNPDPDSMTETKPDPKPTTTNDANSKLSRVEKAVQLSELLTEVRLMLFERKLNTVDDKLAEAESLVTNDDQKEKLARLKQLSSETKAFWEMVVDRVSGMQSLDEITLKSGNLISIIEASKEKVSYRFNGQQYSTAPIQLNIGIAMQVAGQVWGEDLDENARITKGAIYAVEALKKPSLSDRALEFWEEAELMGSDVTDLKKYLTDKYDFLADVIDPVKVPGKSQLETAEKSLKEKYRKEFGKVTPAARKELAETLVAAVPAESDIAIKYVMFKESAELFARAGDIPALITTLETMNKWFDGDLLKNKSTYLKAASKLRIRPEAAEELARTAVGLAEDSARANNFKISLELATTAVAAAAKTRNRDLRTTTLELKKLAERRLEQNQEKK